jgi:glucokinase
MADESSLLLAGDIGGTKTVLAVFSRDKGLKAPLAEATFPSQKYESLEAIVAEFLKTTGLAVKRAGFGVAGPVVLGKSTITNLPWILDEEKIRETFHLDAAYLLNDLASIANSVPQLEAEDLYTLKEGTAIPGGAIAVIAPGTGLGEAFLTFDGERYRPHASEGGHTDYAPRNPLEIGLLEYMLGKKKRISYERVCSGMGIANIYSYLRDTGKASEPEWLAEELAGLEDPVPVIINTALDETRHCEICALTLDTFIAILGAEAGNMGLKMLATGGVYLGGGIPPRILDALKDGRFVQAFQDKGRLSHLLVDMPVHVILNPRSALLGAAAYGFFGR